MSEATLVCANHPDRQTGLRCNRCGKPICSECAVHTPVGYRCPECVRQQQKVFETARPWDLPVAFIVAALGVGAATWLLAFLGFWGILLAPVVGGGLGEVVRWSVRRRRSRRLPTVAVAGGVLGMLPALLPPLAVDGLALVQGAGAQGLQALFGALFPLIYGVLLVSAIYYRLRGIRL